jgi:16S rRNA processing protein RimM
VTPETDTAWVALAEIARPHGVRGELRLRLYNPDSDVLLHQKSVQLTLPSGVIRTEVVKGARRANDAILMYLASVSDRDVAEPLRGSTVSIPRDAFERLDAGEFYAVDVIGSQVVERLESGETVDIGRVKDFVSYPTVDVFVVQADGGEALDVPSTEAFVVDVQKGLVTLQGLDVLREIAQTSKPKVKAPRVAPERVARHKRPAAKS